MSDETTDYDPAVPRPLVTPAGAGRHPHPAQRGSVADLAAQLRELRMGAGVSLTMMVEALNHPDLVPPLRRQPSSPSRLHDLEQGRVRFIPWELVLGYLGRCGVADPAEVSTWRRRWEAAERFADQFEDAYRVHRLPLLRFVRRLVERHGLGSGQVDCEGIVHDTFLEAMRQWETIENPPAWMFTVARRLVRRASTVARRMADADDADLEWARWSSVALRPSVEDVYHAKEVATAIAAMTDRRRVIMHLRQVEGWSSAEIAELLQVPPQTVYNDTFIGTNQLRAQFAPPVSLQRSPMAPPLVPSTSRWHLLRALLKPVAAGVLSLAVTLLLHAFEVDLRLAIPLGVAAAVVLGVGGPAARRLFSKAARRRERRHKTG